jgi:nickel/cobalt exporter
LKYGSQWNAETTEPYFQLVSAVIIAALAIWMFWRTRRDTTAAAAHKHHHHDHGDSRVIDTGHGLVNLSVFETGVPPVFRLAFSGHGPALMAEPSAVSIETVRPGNVRQTFAFVEKDGFLESTAEIPEPHEFDLTLTISHAGHTHTFPVEFREHEHGHSHAHGDLSQGAEFQDAHEAAHALDIQKRFLNRQVTTPQIVLFGLTGGLLPCPAAFSVLIVCMQVKQFTLGFALVAAFSFGLALTMVTVGATAAWSVGHAEKKFSGFGNAMRKAPYLSCALLLILASYMAWQGWHGLPAHH